ncbi:MAG: nucleotidyltransferase family protein, partial [Gammaproteobacteria bacterium]|nr:nucleotidyltransferase family protein [Gammaproteobacteria bacterium]
GRGERMRPLTDQLPKPLLSVGGKSLIEYHLEKLKAANITEVVINHAWLGEKIELALGDGSRYGLRIQYSAEGEALETAGGIVKALSLLGDEAFIVINGDIFCDYEIKNLPSVLSGLAHLVLVKNPLHHPQGDFVLTDSRHVVESGSEKLTFSGIGVYHPDLFKDFQPGKRALAPVLRDAMQHQQVTGEYYQGIWHDIGTPERLNELDKSLLNH